MNETDKKMKRWSEMSLAALTTFPRDEKLVAEFMAYSKTLREEGILPPVVNTTR